MLVGLCGRSGSGKGYIAAMFADRGVPSVDTDKVYRDMTGPCEILSPCMTELKERFGDCVVAVDGSLDRGVMRSLVFWDGTSGTEEECRNNLADLNRITHRHILAETERIAEAYSKAGADIVLIDAPVLFESGFDSRCAAVICVTAPEEVRIARIMKRDGIDREASEKRLRSQMDAEELKKRSDYVIENDADRITLYARVDAVIEALRSRQNGQECLA
ncbi:MAG: dephospho-CoA kinase [Clostridia bacterium]|nr:dephospho-CoA kinase [Clostridia bacterium]